MKQTRAILLVIGTFFFNLVHGQSVDFNFQISGSSACNPTTVSFLQQASSNPTAFFWNFGNGQTSNSPSPRIIFGNAGTFNVTLTAIYPDKVISVTKPVVIHPTPSVSIAAQQTSFCKTGSIPFTANASGNITQLQWSFGDSTAPITNTAFNTSHAFNNFGNYTVKVLATTDKGCSAQDSISIQIQPIAITGMASPVSGCIPINSTLSVNPLLLPNDQLQQVNWNLGNGYAAFTSTTPSVQQTFSNTSVISSATAEVMTTSGCRSVFTFPTFGFGIPPSNLTANTVANIDSFCASENVAFYATADNANQYEWNFGDGSIVVAATNQAFHQYRILGWKQVVCTPMLNGCRGVSKSFNIFIKGVVANFVYANLCGEKNNYQFTNQSLGNIDQYRWTYFDYTSPQIDSIHFNPSHVYPVSGTHGVQLYLNDFSTGCSDSMFRFIYTARPVLKSETPFVCRDSIAYFRVDSTYPRSTQFVYDFHFNGQLYYNSDSNSIGIPTRNFGPVNAFVVIRDFIPGTCNDTLYLSTPLIVKGPTSLFSAPSTSCSQVGIPIQNNSFPYDPADSIVAWKWSFNDGTQEFVEQPGTHVYNIPSIYDIYLLVTDQTGCAHISRQRDTVYPTPPITLSPDTLTMCRGNSNSLYAITADSISWFAGDLSVGNSNDTLYIQPNQSIQYVAQVHNSFGCRNSDTSYVTVIQPIQVNTGVSLIDVCPQIPVQLSVDHSGIIQWSPLAGLRSPQQQTTSALPSTTTLYTVIVKDSIGCFSDTASTLVNVYPPATVDAGTDRWIPFNSSFTISPVFSSNIQQYLWNSNSRFVCNNCTSYSGTLTKSTTYSISVTDINGCKATDEVTLKIACDQSNLLLPAAFSPNGDGLNEYFYPITRGYKTITKMLVMNRSGNLVFERKQFQPNQPNLGWDGSFKGESNQGPQTFTWIIEAECEAGEKIYRQGTVVLLR